MSDRTLDAHDGVFFEPPRVAAPPRKKKVYCSAGCGRRASKECAFELSGSLAGKKCCAALCDRCSPKDLCPAHARLKKGE